MIHRIHCLAGLPRSGSTLLGSILNQNPNVYVSSTSPMYSLLVNANEHLNTLDMQHTFDKVTIGDKIYRSIVDAFYPEDRSFPIVFDKHRGWPKHVDAIRDYVDSEPKIICPIRPIAEIIASYITLAEKDENNFIDRELRAAGGGTKNEDRANYLWQVTMKSIYENMTIGLKMHPNSILLVQYDDIVYSPDLVLESIYRFCDMEPYDHDFESIKNTCAEDKDEAWGMRNLHDIRPTLRKTSINPLCYLPRQAVEYFSQFDLEESWHKV